MKTDSWVDPSRYIEKIFVERSCVALPYTDTIIERASVPVAVVGPDDFSQLVKGDYPENLGRGKKILLLCRNRGHFLKKCPSTREYRCCDYQVINIGMGCPMDCVYCILQAYLNNAYLSFFVNIEELFFELSESLAEKNDSFHRIGTGEFTDSMALDRITGLSRLMVNFFSTRENAVLELKTKSAYVENLKDLDHRGRTIIAWSLNSPEISRTQELRTATLKERLSAAAQCASWGYPLAFHFDPVIEYNGWQSGYRETIDALFDMVPAASIRWISLGGFRFLPNLKQTGIIRFPGSQIFHAEFIQGLDKKQRYFRSLRVDLYRHIYQAIKRRCAAETCVYFCMESDEVWKEVTGFVPAERGGLGTMLDMAAQGRMNG